MTGGLVSGERLSHVFGWGIATATALVLALAGPASAGTLDQQQTNVSFNPPNGFSLVGNPPGAFNQSGGQVFTSGITGALDQVDLSFNKTANPPNPVITVQIRSTSAGSPGGNGAVLATASVNGAGFANTQAFVPISIAPAVPVTAGTQYAIVAFNAGSAAGSFGWGQAPTDTAYAGGSGYNSPDPLPPNTTWNPLGGDLAFKTYVVPSPTGSCKGQQATQVGTAGSDVIVGTSGPDVIAALGGKDTVSGLGGKDLICGGAGKDKLNGGAAKDTLLGEGGKDKLTGGGAKDVCKGGKGDDSGSCEVEKSL